MIRKGMKAAEMYRVEDKFSCDRMSMYLLESRISSVLKPDGNSDSLDGYGIFSVYFDDLYDTSLQDTIDGNPVRRKYRIRIYNNSFETIKLEIKEKDRNRVLKKSKNISYEQMQMLLKGECIEDDCSFDDAAALFNLAIKEKGLRPKIIVAYERKAYVFEAGNVRITFDRNIRATAKIENFGKPGAYYEKLKEYGSVLEVKYDEFLPGFIAQLLELGNMQQTSYSKYKLCREMC